jgi:hypothetical protein
VKILYYTLVCVSLLVVGLGAIGASAYETENVFLVVINGVRNSEAFDDPDHAYIPHIWNDLRPQGAIYTQFYNTGRAITTSCHLSLLSGKCQSAKSSNRRGEEPTIFECFRAATGTPRDDVWFVTNATKATCGGASYSLHPAYGSEDGAMTAFLPRETNGALAESLNAIIDTYQPTLCVVLFKECDYEAHTGNWDGYVKALSVADNIVYLLWQKIQDDPHYQDRTSLIVMTDHGRHDDLHGGFIEHGCACAGCRHLMFLAVGPDIESGAVIDERGDITDVAPTVAELMGFEMPMADGRILTGMLKGWNEDHTFQCPDSNQEHNPRKDQVVRLTTTAGISRDPTVMLSSDQGYAAWLEESSTGSGRAWDVWFADLEDPHGAECLFQASEDSTPVWVSLAADAGTDIYAAFPYMLHAPDQPGADSTYVYGVSGRAQFWRSEWLTSESILPPIFHIFPAGITLDVWTSWRFIAGQHTHLYVPLAWQEGGGTWEWAVSEMVGHGVSEYVDAAFQHFSAHVGWIDCWEGGIDPQFIPRYTRFTGMENRLEVVLEDFTSEMRHMKLAARDNRIAAVWADMSQGHWEVYWTQSTDGGNTWDRQKVRLSFSGVGAWRPDVFLKSQYLSCVVWEDYRHGQGEIYGRISTDGGRTWSPEIRITDDPAESIRPVVAVSSRGAYVVWQDRRDGNWEIYSTLLSSTH